MYQLIEVLSKEDKKEFLAFPSRLYRDEKNWIHPLDKDIEEVFDPDKNALFGSGKCIRWLLKDSAKGTVGRVAAFYDENSSRNNQQPTGGLGFFECINDKRPAFILFDACKKWHQENGMEAMDGPINFGNRDRWWGCLKDGFSEPNYAMPYNFAYYNDLFESYGFKNYFNQYTYYRKFTKTNRMPEIADDGDLIFSNPDYVFRNFEKKKTDDYAADFCRIYNEAWADFTGVKRIDLPEAISILKRLRPLLDERLMIFTYFKNQPIGFYISHPEINQLIKHVDARFCWWDKLRFMYLLKRGKCKKVLGIIFGIVPEFRRKGLASAQLMKIDEISRSPQFHYKDMEINWIGDFNPVIMKIVERTGAAIHKTHVTYRFLFDRTKEFKRAGLVNTP